MGWLHEGQLLSGSYPDDPISAFIYLFSSRHLRWFLLVMALVVISIGIRMLRHKRLHITHVADIPSAYPTLLLITLAAASLLYGHIQHACPQLWVQFYFHPTLNPLAQPGLICLFSSWACGFCCCCRFFATLNNVLNLPAPEGGSHLPLLPLPGLCVVVYLVLSFTASTLSWAR